MAATDLPGNGNKTLSPKLTTAPDQEGGTTSRLRGGWVTFPFLTVGVLGLTIAAGGWMSNLIVFLMERFNIKSIDAAQISNIVNGCSNLFPVAGAILADSFSGSFSVISISSIISLLGIGLLTITASLPSLRPPHCKNGTEICESPSALQLVVLYTAITLVSIGLGGTRFTIATMGADQFDEPKDQDIFFNWYFFAVYVASVIGYTVIVYVQDNVGWALGFGLCLMTNMIGLAFIVLGRRYYRRVKLQGSPFTSLAQVIVATIRKWKVLLSSESKDYYYGNNEDMKLSKPPSMSFRFLNRAALKTEGDTNADGLIVKSWRLCTVQQVEDLKKLIRIFPLWSTSIFLSIPIGIQIGLIVLQALTMDRHLGKLRIPAGAFLVFSLSSCAIFLFIIDRFIFPAWQKLTGRTLTPLQRVGIGHVLNIAGMAGSALVESRRLHVARSHNLTNQTGSVVPMSSLWLVPPLAIVGVGEAFHFPGQVSLYYQEFPISLRSTSTAMISLLVAIGFYLSTALIDFVRRVTSWLPDNINDGRLDNVYWLLVVIGVINFVYYLTCAVLYKYQNVEKLDKIESINSS